MNIRAWMAGLIVVTGAAFGRADTPRTTAEASGYQATTRYAEVVAFGKSLASQCGVMAVQSLGKSAEGRDIPLWVLAEPKVESPDAARKSGKPIVLLLGNIHAGEVDGKEALMALSRDLATGSDKALLKDLIILVVPIFNADGNERLAKGKRAEQGGPDEVGDRENASGFDLNRDFVKLETPEVRGLVECLNRWDPAVVADFHTTNGSRHRHVMTHDRSRHPNAERAAELATPFVAAAADRMAKATGFVPFPYGNFSADRSRWETYPANPRYGIQYVGLRGRVGVLSESYSYAKFADRVKASHEFARGICQEAANRADDLKKLRSAKPAARLALRNTTVAEGPPRNLLGFADAVDGKPAEHREYSVAVISKVEPKLEVARPAAYLIRPGFRSAVECLQRHGVQLAELREDVLLDVETYRVNKVDSAARAFQGHTLRRLEVTPRAESMMIPAGSVVVRMDQELGTLAGLLLEPQCEDGLTTWNFFDEGLKEGADFPVRRVPQLPNVLTGPVRPLPERRTMNKPIDIPLVFGGRPVSFTGQPTRPGEWLADGEHFLQAKDGKLMKVHARTGRAEPFVDPKKLAESIRAIPELNSVAAEWSGRTSFNFDPSRQAAFFNHQKDLYLARLDGQPIRRLTRNGRAGEFPTMSPSRTQIAHVFGGNLYVTDADGRHLQITFDGGGVILNGKADWVYEEEIFDRNGRAFWWSPGGEHIAFLRFDDSPVAEFTVVNHIPTRLDVEKYPYPKAGDPNPLVSLGIRTIPADLGAAVGPAVNWVALPGWDPHDMLILRVGWLDHSTGYVAVANRIQNRVEFHSFNPGGRTQLLFTETTKAWVDDTGPLLALEGGDFLYLSDRTGWRHLYRYAKDGTLKGPVTTGAYEVRKVLHVNAKEGWVVFQGTRDSHVAENVYRVRLDTGVVERLTPESGTHAANFSPTGTLFVDTVSSLANPPQVRLRAADGSLVRTLDTNPVYGREEYTWATIKPVEVPLEGFTTQGIIVKPPQFDATRKYPVWVKTYAGPHAPTVSDSWNAVRLDDHLLASLGIVVFKVDPRSASGRGAQSTWTAYRQLGVQELKDLETAVDWLGKNSWVDLSRVGLSGHSYGGFITGYALARSKKFSAGVSGAPVTDWRLYDSIYTERYMGLPADNKAGYDATSVIKAADKLHGRLLLLHGLMDDNVHVQNSVQLIQALQRADRDFEVMVYPTARHGIIGRHYQRQVFNFICQAMGLDARVPDRNSPTDAR